MDSTSLAPRARPSLLLLSALFAISAPLLSACPGPEGCSDAYRLVASELDEGLLSVWGASATDVWTVGSDAGAGPLVLRWNGAAWARVATGATGDLWWVHGWEDGTVFASGEGGMILRWDGTAFTRMTTPAATGTVFGMWGPSPSDVYAVGGVGGTNGFVWHFDGTAWSAVTLPADFTGAAVFKVWGTSASDVWICGFAGLLYHFDGAAWSRVDSTSTRTLLTLHAIDGEVTAVGGAGTGVLVERAEDGTWHDMAPELTPQLMGVWLTPEGGRASGINGTILRREGGAWAIEETGLDLVEHLHSVWIDPEGGVWSVGGQILAEPYSDGVIVYQGCQTVGAP